MKLERLTDLRELRFNSPDFQVGVRSDTDGCKLKGKLDIFLQKFCQLPSYPNLGVSWDGVEISIKNATF